METLLYLTQRRKVAKENPGALISGAWFSYFPFAALRLCARSSFFSFALAIQYPRDAAICVLEDLHKFACFRFYRVFWEDLCLHPKPVLREIMPLRAFRALRI